MEFTTSQWVGLMAMAVLWVWLMIRFWGRFLLERSPVHGLSKEARYELDEAVRHWNRSKRRDDDDWNMAFSTLNQAFDLKGGSYENIRRYMNLTEDGRSLFRCYQSEIYD